MPIRLDARLALIASLVEGRAAADIGCDHGKLGYYLVGTERVERAICTDISAKSLQKASELAFANGVSDLMPTRLGDGLEPIADREVDTVVIAGLGGDVIASVLEGARRDGKRFAHYVLSPNTHPEKVRREILRHGHRIVFDRLIEVGGKRYSVIKTEEGDMSLDPCRECFGAFFWDDPLAIEGIREELEFKRKLLVLRPSDGELVARVGLLSAALDEVEARSETAKGEE